MEGLEGSWRKPSSRVARVAALVAAVALVACGSEAAEKPAATGPQVIKTSDPGRTFAPIVHFHSDERYFPTSASKLVEEATLEWAGGVCPYEVIAAGREIRQDEQLDVPPLRARDLGEGARFLRSPLGADCKQRDDASEYVPSANTRPFRTDYRPPKLPVDQGYYLNFSSWAQQGQQPGRRGGQAAIEGVPAYVQYRPAAVDAKPAIQLVYWLAFGATWPVTAGEGGASFEREGGWERVVVLVKGDRDGNRFVPIYVRYYAHDGRRELAWEDAPKVSDGEGPATHPVAFAALGSHALYPRPGRREHPVRFEGRRYAIEDVTKKCDACPVWRTWELLRDVEKEPWHGFGGAWGAAGASSQASGPVGPSPFIHDLD